MDTETLTVGTALLLFLAAATQAVLIMLFVWWLADRTTPHQPLQDN